MFSCDFSILTFYFYILNKINFNFSEKFNYFEINSKMKCNILAAQKSLLELAALN